MPTQTYDLLTIKVAADSHGYGAQGYLANQGVDLVHRHPVLTSLAGVVARCSRRGECRLLGLEMTADSESEQLSARAVGPLAPLVRRPLRKLVDRLNGLGRPFALRDGGFVYNLYQPPVPSKRMINHFARRIVRRSDPLRPSTCTLEVTAHCQLDCYHCSAARFTTKLREELTTAEWFSVIAQALDLGILNIVFTGGEPLLRPDIYELVAAVDRDRAQPMMFTNGLLLTAETVRRLAAAGLYSVYVSLDDPRPEVHDQLRRAPNGFARAVAGIEQALAGGLLVGISTYATPQAVREGRVEQIIELGKRLGVHEVTVFDFVPTGKLLPLQQKDLLSGEDKQALIALERARNQCRECPHIITQALVNGPEGAGCFAGYSQFYMTAYGDVNPCDFTPLTFGNIRDERLEAIWDRMLTHPAYQNHSDHCRMQDPAFRRQYIDDIPDGVLLPWPAMAEVRAQPHGPDTARAGRTVAPAAHEPGPATGATVQTNTPQGQIENSQVP
jgi:MoaA/NifB/PqqE/SkfB family radical SAM enzyme